MRNRNLFNRIQRLIAGNELSAAIQILLELPLEKSVKDEVVITSSRLEEFNKKERTGLGPKEEELNKIRSSILQILNHFSKAEESKFLSLSTSTKLQKVLIIFDSKDIFWAQKLQLQLEEKNLAVILDRWNLSINDDCPPEFEELLNSTDSSIVLIGPSGDNPWQNGQVRIALKRLFRLHNENYKVTPVLLPNAMRGERSRLPIFLSRAKWLSYGMVGGNEELSSILMELQDSKLDIELSDSNSNVCPYRGLEYFDIHHASHFFGREATTDWLIEGLKSNRKEEKNFLAIVGASGSGKSSIARAGLLASLKDGALKGSEDWKYAILRPGYNPLENLAIACVKAFEPKNSSEEASRLIAQFSKEESALHLFSKIQLGNPGDKKKLVLLIDQFEEVFTLCKSERERTEFIDNIVYASSILGAKIKIVITLRVDFYGACSTYPEFSALLTECQYLIGPLDKNELIRAIKLPAIYSGVSFERGLPSILVREVLNQPGELPSLQYILRELWYQQRDAVITHDSYDFLGGLEGVLEKRAEEIFFAYEEKVQDVFKKILIRLIMPEERTVDLKRKVEYEELLGIKNETEITTEDILLDLSDAETRLITIYQEGNTKFVEISHEALIRNWSRLDNWLKEGREAFIFHRKLTNDANQWVIDKKDKSYLYAGRRLKHALDLRPFLDEHLNEIESSFLAESEKQHEKIQQILNSREEVADIVEAYNKMLNQLEESEEKLKQSERELAWRQMARQVAHEIKNPLTPMKLNIQHLNRAFNESEPRLKKMFPKVMKTLLAQIDALTRIANSFSEFAKMPEPLNTTILVNKVLLEVVDLYTQSEETIWLIDIPTEEFWSYGDREQLSRCFVNIFKNSLQAVGDNGIIHVSMKIEDNLTSIEIKDNGKGMALEVQKRIFEPSFSTKSSGMGLGLAIVKRIIENMKGEITFRSEENVGTTFRLVLPSVNS